MKISIISAHFSPQLGYQENCIAKSLKRLGNEVSVITTTFISPRYRKILKPFKTGEYLHEGYRIIRLSTLLRLRQTVIPSGMKKVLYKIHPDVLICIGITKFMPLPAIYFARKNKTKVISIFGNLKKHYSLFFKKFLYKLLKEKWENFAIKNSDRIILTTPETFEILSHKLRNKDYKILPLGFDGERFYYSEEIRKIERKKLNLKDDFVFINATTHTPEKKLDKMLDKMFEIMKENSKVKMIMTGFVNSSYSKFLRRKIEESGFKSRFLLYPFVSQRELFILFNIADCGIWTQECITIQQAMGTGLPVIVPYDKATSHLVKEGKNGFYYKDFDNLAERMKKICERHFDRNEIEKFNQFLNYDRIVVKMLEGLC